MRILLRRLWWTGLLGLVTNASISLQILIQSTSVQAQVTPKHEAKAPEWEDPASINGQLYPNAESACKAVREGYIDGSSLFDYAEFIPPIESVYSTTATTTGIGALCHFKVGITDLGQYLDAFRVVDLVCSNAPDGSDYTYTGGANGLCILSSQIQANDNKKPDWCTGVPDTYTYDNQVADSVDFSPACRNHDLCYWTIAPEKVDTKPICDKNFYSQLKDICDEKFANEITTPLKVSGRQKCYNIAGIYYDGVSGTGLAGLATGSRAQSGYNDAQGEAGEVRTYLESRLGKNAVPVEYDKDIAWELASRQATGEGISTSIANAENSIATNIISNR